MQERNRLAMYRVRIICRESSPSTSRTSYPIILPFQVKARSFLALNFPLIFPSLILKQHSFSHSLFVARTLCCNRVISAGYHHCANNQSTVNSVAIANLGV